MKKNNKLMTKRTISAIMASCMVLGSGAALAADLSKTDIPADHWAADVLSDFIDKGYLSGYGDNTYKPDQEIIRAEYVALINKVEGFTEASDEISKFTDVKESDWCYEHLAIALKAGYLTGTSDTTLSPNDLITREQAFTMIGHILGMEDGTREDLAGFSDADQVSDWAVPYVGALVRNGIVAGRSDGNTVTISPLATMTRAEGVQVLSNSLENQTESGYVLMNIPYADFYAADVRNDVEVDAFTSATLAKTRIGSLVGGSYHVDPEGSDITGVAFPVKLGEGVTLADLADAGYKRVTDKDSVTITVTNRGQTTTTTYEGPDALFENESYAYYALKEEPEFYKELTLNEDGTVSFGEVQGEVQTVSGVTTELTLGSHWGDYELAVDGFDNIDASTDKVYGVVVSTDENDYGLRQLENIWRGTELAWSTGFTPDVSGCPTRPAHYEAIMGQTINKLTYYTSKGIFELPLENAVYVPVMFENTLAVEDAAADSHTTSVTMEGFPEDYAVQYSITNAKGNELEGATCDGETITWTGTPISGAYTLTVTDENGKYAPVSASFQLTSEGVVAEYDAENYRLVKADGVSDEEFENYLANITNVSVDGTDYAATGHGSVTIINSDGTINLDAGMFEAGETYTIQVTSAGYETDLVFEMTTPDGSETFTGTATTEPDEFLDFDAYDIQIDVVVKDDVIQSISLNSGCTIDADNEPYFDKALNTGRGSIPGIAAQLTGKSASEIDSVEYDVVSTATCSSHAIVAAVQDALK